MADTKGTVCFDEYGRPFVLMKEEALQARVTGLEALKMHILAARSVAGVLSTSLGPRGMDKLLVSPDGDVVVTNDGATILELMDVDHEVAKLMVQLARSQDKEAGDGTTGVVVLAGALLDSALELLDKGVHPTRIADGYGQAARTAVGHLETISFQISTDADNTTSLLQAAMTALSSKIASKCQSHLAEIAVNAFKATCGLGPSSPEPDSNSIVLRLKSGGQIEDTELIRGVVIGKNFVHPQMKRAFQNARVAVLSSGALQAPKVHAKHQLNVENSKGYKEIRNCVDNWCCKVVNTIIGTGAELVICPGTIEDAVVHMMLRHGVSAVEAVPDCDVKAVAVSVGARVVPRVEELTRGKLGQADLVRVVDFGTTEEKWIVLEQRTDVKIVTVFVRGGNEVVVEEVKRSLQDALGVIRNLVKDKSAVYGGGAAEIQCSLALERESLRLAGVEQLVFQAFAEALDAVPLALARNAGGYPLQVLTELKSGHRPWQGVDCLSTGDCDMRRQGVLEPLLIKRQQLVLATQLARMVLKIDDVRGPRDDIDK